MKELLKPSQVAEKLNVHILTVYRWIKAGKLIAINIGIFRPNYLISPTELEKFLASNKKEG